jgi:hypothetical protein
MLLNLSDENFLNNTQRFNKHPLNKKDDVQLLITIVVKFKREKQFNELIFTAKYLKGLLRIVNKAPCIPEVESIDHIKSDISENMKKVVEQLRNLISGTEANAINLFEKNYLSLDQKNFSNLNLLLDDLESLKKYLNHLKHSQ